MPPELGGSGRPFSVAGNTPDAGLASLGAHAQEADPLPSWNDGPAKQAILDLVRATSEPGSPDFGVGSFKVYPTGTYAASAISHQPRGTAGGADQN